MRNLIFKRILLIFQTMSMYGMKKEPLVNHVRERSMNLVITLSKILALDEMMICFLGRSHETNKRSLNFVCFC